MIHWFGIRLIHFWKANVQYIEFKWRIGSGISDDDGDRFNGSYFFDV